MLPEKSAENKCIILIYFLGIFYGIKLECLSAAAVVPSTHIFPRFAYDGYMCLSTPCLYSHLKFKVASEQRSGPKTCSLFEAKFAHFFHILDFISILNFILDFISIKFA